MGKKEKRAREINQIAKCIQKNDIKSIRNGFSAIREQAIEDSKSNIDWYFQINQALKGNQRSEAATVFKELEDKTARLLSALEKEPGSIMESRDELINVIYESQNSLYEQISSTGIGFNDRFYLQEVLIDMAFAKASNAENALDIVGMYYDMLSQANKEDQDEGDSDIEDFLEFFGNSAAENVISRASQDIRICHEKGKFDLSVCLNGLPGIERKDHIKALVDEIKKTRTKVAKTRELSQNKSSGGENSDEGGISSGDKLQNRKIKKQSEPRNKEKNEGKALKNNLDNRSENGIDIKAKYQADFVYRHFGVLVIGVIAAMLLTGCIGFMIGFSAGKKSVAASLEQPSLGSSKNSEETDSLEEERREENVEEESDSDNNSDVVPSESVEFQSPETSQSGQPQQAQWPKGQQNKSQTESQEQDSEMVEPPSVEQTGDEDEVLTPNKPSTGVNFQLREEG